MDPTDRLAHNLVAESEAYGYTLTIWGAGAMLIHRFGMPDLIQVFLYVTGALAGFGSLGLIAFDHFVTELEPHDRGHLVVTSMVHIVSTLGNLALVYLLVEFVLVYGFPDWSAFLLVGLQATFTYNGLLLLEGLLSERFARAAPFVTDTEELD